MRYTLFFTARPKMCRYLEACMCGCAPSGTVIVCESLWCDHMLEVLLCYQTYTPSPLLSALLSYNSTLTTWYRRTLCVCVPVNSRAKNTPRYQTTRLLEISKHTRNIPYKVLSKQSTSWVSSTSWTTSPPWHPDEGNEAAGEVTEPAEPGLIH